jgi:D-aminoacyl-tRNA deacylase
MKALIQRVTCAKVTVDGQLISEIGKGLCILIGICKEDDSKDVEFL